MSHPTAALLDAAAATGREPGGAVCVISDGEVVVDHVVGTRDGRVPWTPDTLVMSYSVAKPFAALTVLDVVAAGRLGLDQPVTDVWPEYGAHGKGATTVRQVLHHSAGLPRFPEAAADLAFDDIAGLTELLAATPPEFEPGSAVAEHALTYGHLCDALVRRATRRRPRRPVRRDRRRPRLGPAPAGRLGRPRPVRRRHLARRLAGRLRDRPALGTGAGAASRPARPGRPQLRALPPLQLPSDRTARQRARPGPLLRRPDRAGRPGRGPARARPACGVRRTAGERPRPAPRPRRDVDAGLPGRRRRPRDGGRRRLRCLVVARRRPRRRVRHPRSRWRGPRRRRLGDAGSRVKVLLTVAPPADPSRHERGRGRRSRPRTPRCRRAGATRGTGAGRPRR